MIGKTCVVTGANSGIGKEIALGLAAVGAEVIIIDRDDASISQREIQNRFSEAKVHCYQADLSDLSQIKIVAEKILQQFPRVDLLVNNAGRHIVNKEISVEGFEMNFALNCLGGFRLTRLLLNALGNSNDARVVNVASEAHRVPGRFNFSDINTDHESMLYAYGKSKYATIALTKALARRLNELASRDGNNARVQAFAVCPGLVATQIFNNFLPGWMAFAFRQLTHLRLMSTSEHAAYWPLQLATVGEPARNIPSGAFVTSHPLMQKLPSIKSLEDRSIQDQLWNLCSELSSLPVELVLPAKV